MRNLHLGLYTPNQGAPKHFDSLFHSTRAVTEKILEEEFGVAMNEELEREVLVMCNLSQGVKAEGREEGIPHNTLAIRFTYCLYRSIPFFSSINFPSKISCNTCLHGIRCNLLASDASITRKVVW